MRSCSFDLWGTLIKSNPDFSVHQEALVIGFVVGLVAETSTGWGTRLVAWAKSL